MSNVLGKESKRVVYKTVRTLEGIRCDICGRVIPVEKYKSDESRYFEVMTGHHDWGAESCESIEHRDICPTCIGGFLSGYLFDVKGTEYVEVETHYAHIQDVSIEDDYVDPDAGTPWSLEQMERYR